MIQTAPPPPGISADGCLPRPDDYGSRIRPMDESEIPNIDRSEWLDLANESHSAGWLTTMPVSQLETHMCASFSTCSAWEVCWTQTMADRLLTIVLSPSSIYNEITGGRPGGSSISDNLKFMQEFGALPADTPKNRALMERMGLDPTHVMPLADYDARPPAGSDKTRRHFRIEEMWDINRWAQLMCATIARVPCVYGRDRHAICSVCASPRYYKQHGVVIKYRNSWSVNWGEPDADWPGGFGYDDERKVSSQLQLYGGGAVRTVVLTPKALRLKGTSV